MPALVQILAINAAVLVVAMLILWRICVAIKDVTVVDSFWAYGMVIMAASTYVQAHGAPQRKALLLGLCALWGLRLGSYLVWRWRSHGPDRRYRTMLGRAETEKGWSFAKSSLLLVFATQAPLLFVVSLPAQLGQISAAPAMLGPVAWMGAAVAVFGVLFESLGDWQLTRFRRDPAKKGTVLDTGLWRYTRHPNYFGDACAWWGIWLVAADTTLGLWAVPGPILLTFLLTRWSGVPTVEGRLRRTRPAYEAYVKRTSAFVPWPPKRAPGV